MKQWISTKRHAKPISVHDVIALANTL
jgi:hypothetical protein